MANFKLAARIRKLLESPPTRNQAEVKCKQNTKIFIVQVYCRCPKNFFLFMCVCVCVCLSR
jgi:hypothetical protein